MESRTRTGQMLIRPCHKPNMQARVKFIGRQISLNHRLNHYFNHRLHQAFVDHILCVAAEYKLFLYTALHGKKKCHEQLVHSFPLSTNTYTPSTTQPKHYRIKMPSNKAKKTVAVSKNLAQIHKSQEKQL